MIGKLSRAVVRILAVAVLAAAVGGCSGAPDSTNADPETLRPYAEKYVSLLSDGATDELREHLANEAQSGDAQDRITAYGNRDWTLTDVSWTSQTPRSYVLSMAVSGPTGNDTWRTNVEWDEDHWVMAPLSPT